MRNELLIMSAAAFAAYVFAKWYAARMNEPRLIYASANPYLDWLSRSGDAAGVFGNAARDELTGAQRAALLS